MTPIGFASAATVAAAVVIPAAAAAPTLSEPNFLRVVLRGWRGLDRGSEHEGEALVPEALRTVDPADGGALGRGDDQQYRPHSVRVDNVEEVHAAA